jgi:hypothetical protein
MDYGINSNITNYTQLKHFIGVVEDRKDPLKLGRVRVRCIGYHTKDLNNIPTNSLPWAVVLYNTKEIYPPKDGSWVFGFFQDGEEAQFPIVLGYMPGIPEENPNNFGFCDQRNNNNTIFNYPKTVSTRTYNNDGTGVEIVDNESTVDLNLNEAESSRLARNENIENTIVQNKIDSRVTEIPIASYGGVNDTYNEPENPYNTIYPFNKVFESESGHVKEYDDTPGSERIHEFHRSGTFYEIHSNGTKVEKIVSDNYIIVMKNDNLYIMGNGNVTIQGNINIYVQNDATIQVGGDTKIYGEGNFDGHFNGEFKLESEGNMSFKAPRIDLN